MTHFARRLASRTSPLLGLLCVLLAPLVACEGDPAPASGSGPGGMGGKQASGGAAGGGGSGAKSGGAGTGGAAQAGAGGSGKGSLAGSGGANAAGQAGSGLLGGAAGQASAGGSTGGGAPQAGAAGAGGSGVSGQTGTGGAGSGGVSGQAGAGGAGNGGASAQGGNAGAAAFVIQDVVKTYESLLAYDLRLDGSTWHVGYQTGGSEIASTLRHAARTAPSLAFSDSPIVHAGYLTDWSFVVSGTDVRFTYADDDFDGGLFQSSNQPSPWAPKTLRASTVEADTEYMVCAPGPGGTTHCLYLVGPYFDGPVERRYLRVDAQGVVSDELVAAAVPSDKTLSSVLFVAADGSLITSRDIETGAGRRTQAERRDPATGAWSAVTLASDAPLGEAIFSPDGVAHYFTTEKAKDPASGENIIVVFERTHAFPASDATPKAEVWRTPPGYESAWAASYRPLDGGFSAAFLLSTDFSDTGKKYDEIHLVKLGTGPAASSRLILSEPYDGDQLEMPRLLQTPKGPAVAWVRVAEGERTIVLAESP